MVAENHALNTDKIRLQRELMDTAQQLEHMEQASERAEALKHDLHNKLEAAEEQARATEVLCYSCAAWTDHR